MLNHLRYYIANIYVLAGVLGLILGGAWVWLGSLGVLIAILIGDSVLGTDQATRLKLKFPWIADFALYLHLPLLIALYLVFGWRLMIGFDTKVLWEQVLLYAGATISVGFLAAIPNLPIAHELLHRRSLFPRAVAWLMMAFFGDANRGLAHNFIHHIYVGTPRDSDTPYRGETIYQFVVRDTIGAFKDGYEIIKKRQANKGKSVWSLTSQVPRAILIVACIIAGFYWAAGWLGALLGTLAMVIGRFFVAAFNYTQHYGLIRADGQPFEFRHTWEHDSTLIRAAGIEITTHTHHHQDAYVPFYELKPSGSEAMRMPHIILCFLASFIPSLWFKKIVFPRLKYVDLYLATSEEKALAREANKKAGWPDWFSKHSEQFYVK